MKLGDESQAVLIKYALIGIIGLIAYTQIKQGVSNTIDLVKNIDLNPFDQNGWLGLKVPIDTLQVSGYDVSHIAALAQIGADINKYRVWYPDPLGLAKMPSGTLQVKWAGNKITYYAPRSGLDVFSL